MNDIENKQDTLDEPVEVPLLKQKSQISSGKPKRIMKKFERSEKQKEAFKITMQKRAENIAIRKEQKKIEAAKLLMSTEPSKEETPKKSKPKTTDILRKPEGTRGHLPDMLRKKKQLVLPESDSDSDSDSDSETDSDSSGSGGEVEKIYIARKSTRGNAPQIKQPEGMLHKPKKVYVINQRVSSGKKEKNIISERYPEDTLSENKFKSQQNKKSVVKISNNTQPPKNYFCD